MAQNFSLTRDLYCSLSVHALHEEIDARTGSRSETEGILRSIERFGRDESIRYYEITQQRGSRTRQNVPTSIWTVRAVR